MLRIGECITSEPIQKTMTDKGKLLLEASCAFNQKNLSSAATPVLITCLHNTIMLRYQDTGACAGIVFSEALPRLVKDHSVTLTASLGARIGPHFASFDRGTMSSTRGGVQVRMLRIIVYGFLSAKNTIKTILDKNDLFLQRPEDFEYDRRVRYLNPMYFTRPGEEYPRLLNRSGMPSQTPTAMTFDEEALGEAQRSRVLKIFDEASTLGEDTSVGLKQSSRIISTLKGSVITHRAGTLSRPMS